MIFGGHTRLLSPKGKSQSPPAMQSVSTPQLLQTPPHAMDTSPIMPSNGSVLSHPQQNSGSSASAKGGRESDNNRREASWSMSAPAPADVAKGASGGANAGCVGQNQHPYDDRVFLHHILQPQLPPPQRTSSSTTSTTTTSSSLHTWTPPPPFVPSAHLQLQHQNQNQHQHPHQPHSHSPHPLSFQRSLPLQNNTYMNLSAEIIPPSTLPLPPHPHLQYQVNDRDPNPNLSRSSSFDAYDATETPIHHQRTLPPMQTPTPMIQSSPPLHGTFPAVTEYAEIGLVSENSGLNLRWTSYLQDSGVFYGGGAGQGS